MGVSSSVFIVAVHLPAPLCLHYRDPRGVAITERDYDDFPSMLYFRVEKDFNANREFHDVLFTKMLDS